jgi:prophage regulatory protein
MQTPKKKRELAAEAPPAELVDAKFIANFLGLNFGHVRDRMSKRPDFPAPYLFGNRVRWNRTEFDQWVLAHRTDPKREKQNNKAEGANA